MFARAGVNFGSIVRSKVVTYRKKDSRKIETIFRNLTGVPDFISIYFWTHLKEKIYHSVDSHNPKHRDLGRVAA